MEDYALQTSQLLGWTLKLDTNYRISVLKSVFWETLTAENATFTTEHASSEPVHRSVDKSILWIEISSWSITHPDKEITQSNVGSRSNISRTALTVFKRLDKEKKMPKHHQCYIRLYRTGWEDLFLSPYSPSQTCNPLPAKINFLKLTYHTEMVC